MSQLLKKEYTKLVDDVRSPNQEDVYQKIMSREDNVLALINRVVDHEQQLHAQLTHNLTLWHFFLNFLRAWKGIYHDVLLLTVNPISLQSIIDIFMHHERKLYVGVLLVIVAIFLFFIEISS